MLSIITLLWLFRESKYVLFWIYLWQLKEYHIPRFIDHFRTHKGRKLISNPFLYLKIGLILLLLTNQDSFSLVFLVLFLAYFSESALFLKAIISKTFKKPVKTNKTIFLFTVLFLIVLGFGVWISFYSGSIDGTLWLLVFDIFTPIIVSLIILILQPIFVVLRNNTLRKAKLKRNNLKKLKVIAITGSYGKTSTKEFLLTILSKKFKTISTKDHQNSEIGIANCIINNVNEDHDIFIVEMGAYKKGGVKLLCNMAQPQMGILTGVNEQHLALFGSLDNLLSAEGGGELSEFIGDKGFLAINGDNKYCMSLHKKHNGAEKIIYSSKKGVTDATIWAEEISVNEDSLSFVAMNKNKEMAHFSVNILGGHNIQNLLGAILVARKLGMSMDEISTATKNIRAEQAGITKKQGRHEVNIIDSSYSSNPDGVIADLEYLNIFKGKKAVIMPCLIELGPKSAELHQKIGKKIGEVCDLAIITSRDKFKELKQGFESSFVSPNKRIILCDNPDEIAALIFSSCKSGDAVLLEGRIPEKITNLLS